MGLTQSIAPAIEPVTLSEAKAHLRVDGTDEDDLITDLIQAAREACEVFTRRQFITATWALTLDEFPDYIELPRPPLQSVTTLAYVDVDGDDQTLTEGTDFDVDITPLVGYVLPCYGESWPSTLGHIADVTVTYKAGYGLTAASVPSAIKAAIKLLMADLYEHREARTEAKLEDNLTVQRLLWHYRVLEA